MLRYQKGGISQIRQSARLFLQSSELWFPQSLTRRGRGHTRLREREWGGVPIRTSGQTLWYSWYICTLWGYD
jgi:hypothetical protein